MIFHPFSENAVSPSAGRQSRAGYDGKRRSARRLVHFTVSLALLFFADLSLSAQTNPVSKEKHALIEKAASAFMAANSVPGVSVALVLNGEPAWSQGFGMADLENFVPASPTTLFRLGSISKPLTATAILQLYERGKLDLDAEIQKYCPSFPRKEAPITTRELLGHLSGIRHYNEGFKGDVPLDSAKHFNTAQDAFKIFANDPLIDKPGHKFHYSTYGYTVLGCVLEGVTSEKYVDYMKENVFAPGDMVETRDDDSSEVIQHRTRFYHKEKSGPVQNAGVLDSSYKIPGGGIISSADDMANYEAAILANKLLRPATRELMWTSQKNADGSLTGYGMGWGTTTKFGLSLAAHNGGQQGASTSMFISPERRAGVIVLANMDGVNTDVLALEILKIALDLSGSAE